MEKERNTTNIRKKINNYIGYLRYVSILFETPVDEQPLNNQNKRQFLRVKHEHREMFLTERMLRVYLQ